MTFCGWMFAIGIVVSLYQSARGFMFQWVPTDSPFRAWGPVRKVFLLALADGFFYLVTTASGFAALAASVHLFYKDICIPPNAVVGQVVDVVKKYLTEHPEERHSAGSEIQLALSAAFPCVPKTT